MRNTNLLRLLVGFVGILVTAIGLIHVLSINANAMAIPIIGAVMWLQSFPVIWASEREERRNEIRKLLKGEKD